MKRIYLKSFNFWLQVLNSDLELWLKSSTRVLNGHHFSDFIPFFLEKIKEKKKKHRFPSIEKGFPNQKQEFKKTKPSITCDPLLVLRLCHSLMWRAIWYRRLRIWSSSSLKSGYYISEHAADSFSHSWARYLEVRWSETTVLMSGTWSEMADCFLKI